MTQSGCDAPWGEVVALGEMWWFLGRSSGPGGKWWLRRSVGSGEKWWHEDK